MIWEVYVMYMASGVVIIGWLFFGLGIVALALSIVLMIKLSKAIDIWIRKNEDE